ncbi:MAG: CPBP family intramembrane glutamic endopeptidase, partial [Kiloniellales bacterium]
MDRLRFDHVLLIVIFGLGPTRLLGMFAGSLFTGPRLPTSDSGPNLVLVVLIALAVHTTFLIGAVYLVAIRRRGLSWRDLGLRPIPAGWTLRAVGATLIAFPMVAGVNLAIQTLLLEAPQHNPQFDVIAPGGFSWSALVGMLIVAGVIVPFAEELFFRGLLYGWLRRRIGAWLAALASALFFSLLHNILWLVPALTVLGVILARVYEKSGSLWAVMVTHGLFNAVTVVVIYVLLGLGVEL